MRRSAACLGFCLVLGSAAVAADAPVGPHGFAKRMIAGIGAEVRACRPEIAREIAARDMTALCARFEGSFARFELRWDLELNERETYEGAADTPSVRPLTDWEINGTKYERIYRVESKAVGVRFDGAGDVMLVW